MSGADEPEIVLLGGSGDVGKRLARMLQERTTLSVTTVSRRKPGDTDHLGGRMRHLSMDISGGGALETAVGSVTVNLTEATPPAVAKRVIGTGGWFLETSATPEYLVAMTDGLRGGDGPGIAVLCVGAAPGMTNLMAAQILASAPKTRRVDIGVEMGMGRHYGEGGTEWFLRSAGQRYPAYIDDEMHTISPGQLKRKFAFAQSGRPRQSIGYGFADQSLIAEWSQHRLKTVRSFVALDPTWMTGALAMMLSLGLGPMISRNAQGIAKWLRRAPAVGPTHTRLVVEGFDETGHLTGQIRLETGDQAEATAAMIFATIQSVLAKGQPPKRGTTMITDHLQLDGAADTLRRFLPETVLWVRIDRNTVDHGRGAY